MFGEFNVVGPTPTFHIGSQASCLCILCPKTVGMFVHFCRCGKKNIYIISFKKQKNPQKYMIIMNIISLRTRTHLSHIKIFYKYIHINV